MGILEGKVAIVTGAARGIGRAHAMELAKQGAKVVVNDVGGSVHGDGQGEDALETVRIIKDRGGEAVANFGDVADYAQAAKMIRQAVDAYGRLDILVNNAGIVRDGAIWNMSDEDFDKVVRVHLKGTWAPCHHAAKYWREESRNRGGPVGGRIINTTSGAGLHGNFGQSNYGAAKAAIAGLTLTLSLELQRIGVTVNCVSPGAMTRITSTIPGFPDPVEVDQLPEGEWNPMHPATSSPVVAWLASDDAAYVTGQVLHTVGDRIAWLKGWAPIKEVFAGEKHWDAEKLGGLMASQVFGVRAPGIVVPK